MPFALVRARAAVARHPGVAWWPVALGALLACGAAPAWSQASGLRLDTGFSATQTFTSNRNLSADDPQSEAITLLTPSLRLSSRSGRVQGSVDYSPSAIFYARGTAPDTISQALAAAASAELVQGRLAVDARASISQQSISAFGPQSPLPGTLNPNQTELRTASLSPSVRGRLFGNAGYEARLVSTVSSSRRGEVGDQVGHVASVRLGDGSRVLGWAVDLERRISDFDAGRRTTTDRANATFTWRPDPEWSAFVRLGQERSDVIVAGRESQTTYGVGGTWTPSPRTTVGLQADRRYFGESYGVNLSHRMRRAVLVYSAGRDSTESTAGGGFSLSLYELYFLQFASIEPDPARRDVLVRDFLAANGLNPNDRITGGFLTNAVTLQRRQNLSLALQAPRSTLVVSAFQTQSRRLDRNANVQDDLANNGRVGQTGWSATASHRLTPSSAVSVSYTGQRTADAGIARGSRLQSVNVGWSTRLGRRANFSVNARHAQSDGARSYEETGASATLGMRF